MIHIYVLAFLTKVMLLFCISWQIKTIVKHSYAGALVSTFLIAVGQLFVVYAVAEYLKKDYIVGVCIVAGSLVGVLCNMKMQGNKNES